MLESSVLGINGCTAHTGADPVWHGGPSARVAQAIEHHTNVDSQGRRYYRKQWGGNWIRLRNSDSAAWRELNNVIDTYR